MAITYVGSVGDVEQTSTYTTSLTITTTADYSDLNFIILGVSHDVIDDYTGIDNNRTSIEGLGIKWEKIQEATIALASPSRYGNGVTTTMFLGQLTGDVPSGSDITVTFNGGSGVNHAIFTGSVFTINSGHAIRLDKRITSNPKQDHIANQLGYPAMTITDTEAIPKERLFFRMITKELGTTLTMTPTAGFTKVWDLISNPTPVASDIIGKAEMIITTDYTVTSDPTSGTVASNYSSVFAAFEEYPLRNRDPAAVSITRPDDITETWRWSTLVTESWNSTEQRMRQMPGPVRSIEAKYPLHDDQELVEWQAKLYDAASNSMMVPYFQYETNIKYTSVAGWVVVLFDPTNTQLHVGDQVIILNPLDDTYDPMIRVVDTINDWGITVTVALTNSLDTDWVIMPVHECYVDAPQFSMVTVEGDFTIRAEKIDRTLALTPDNYLSGYPTYNSLPVVLDKTLSGITHKFDIETEDFATQFGARQRVTSWLYPKTERSVSFFVGNRGSMTDFNRWVSMFDYLAGQLKAFYIASGLNDVTLFENYANGDNFFKAKGSYFTDYIGNDPAYSDLNIYFSDGVWRQYGITSVASQLDGNDKFTLDATLPNDLTIVKISYLYRVRLATDVVNVKHGNNKVYFGFAIRGTQQ